MPKQPQHKNGRKSPPDTDSPETTGEETSSTINNRKEEQDGRTEEESQKPDAASRARAPRPGGIRYDWQEEYLDELSRTGQVTIAAEKAGVNRQTLADHRRRDAAFAMDEASAFNSSKHTIESEAVRRALAGSDALMLRLLERMETGSWRQKQQIEHTAPGIFATRAERKAALEKLRQETREREARSLSGTVPLSLPSETEVAGREVTERDPWKKGAE